MYRFGDMNYNLVRPVLLVHGILYIPLAFAALFDPKGMYMSIMKWVLYLVDSSAYTKAEGWLSSVSTDPTIIRMFGAVFMAICISDFLAMQYGPVGMKLKVLFELSFNFFNSLVAYHAVYWNKYYHHQNALLLSLVNLVVFGTLMLIPARLDVSGKAERMYQKGESVLHKGEEYVHNAVDRAEQIYESRTHSGSNRKRK